MTSSLKMVVIFTTVTLIVTSSPVVVPQAKRISDMLSSTAPVYPEYSLATAYRNFSNNIGKTFIPQIKETKNTQRNALEQKLRNKGYNERFLNLLNDHSLIALARKEGLAVKDWRI